MQQQWSSSCCVVLRTASNSEALASGQRWVGAHHHHVCIAALAPRVGSVVPIRSSGMGLSLTLLVAYLLQQLGCPAADMLLL
jgi:hypothetical protein